MVILLEIRRKLSRLI